MVHFGSWHISSPFSFFPFNELRHSLISLKSHLRRVGALHRVVLPRFRGVWVEAECDVMWATLSTLCDVKTCEFVPKFTESWIYLEAGCFWRLYSYTITWRYYYRPPERCRWLLLETGGPPTAATPRWATDIPDIFIPKTRAAILEKYFIHLFSVTGGERF